MDEYLVLDDLYYWIPPLKDEEIEQLRLKDKKESVKCGLLKQKVKY